MITIYIHAYSYHPPIIYQGDTEVRSATQLLSICNKLGFVENSTIDFYAMWRHYLNRARKGEKMIINEGLYEFIGTFEELAIC